MKLRSIYLWACILSLGATLVIGALAIVFSLPGTEELLITTIIFTLYALVGVGLAFAIERAWHPKLALVTLALATLTAVAWFIYTWASPMLPWDTRERVIISLGVLSVITAFLIHFVLLAAVPLKHHAARWLRTATFITTGCIVSVFIATTLSEYFSVSSLWFAVFIGIAAVCFTIFVVLRRDRALRWIFASAGALAASIPLNLWIYEDTNHFPEFIGLLLLFTGIGTAFVPLIGAIEFLRTRAGGEDSSITETIPVTVACPRCEAPLTISTNKPERCTRCKLRIRVQIEEPRCVCGYLLYKLTSDTCPECGKPIPEADRWTPSSPPSTPLGAQDKPGASSFL